MPPCCRPKAAPMCWVARAGCVKARASMIRRPRSGAPEGSCWRWVTRSCTSRSEVAGLEIGNRHRPPQQVALECLASQARQHLALRLGLDALGDHGQPQALTQGDDGLNDDRAAVVVEQARHEGLVDLELVQRQALQVGQRGVTGPEVVERETDTQLLESAHLGDDVVNATD